MQSEANPRRSGHDGYVWKRSADHPANPTHSRVMRAGDPAEHICIAHADGSYSQVKISVEADNLDIALTPSDTHEPHLHEIQ